MRILMVCLGNICRSPLAHGILADMIRKQGLDWSVDSAGTGNWHVGQAPDRRSVQTAKEHGVDISQQKAQWFRAMHFDQYDKILVMDRQNYRDVLALAETEAHKAKVALFLPEGEVPDPYFDDALFAPVYDMIRVRLDTLVHEWLSVKSSQE